MASFQFLDIRYIFKGLKNLFFVKIIVRMASIHSRKTDAL